MKGNEESHAVLARVRRELEQRREELEPLIVEHTQIVRTLEAMDGTEEPPAPTRGGRSTKGGAVAKRGERKQMILDAIRERPGRSRSDYAEFMGVTTGAVHGPFQQLEKEGAVEKRGSAYYIAGTAPS